MQATAIKERIETMTGTIEKIQGQIGNLIAEGKISNDREIDLLQRDRTTLLNKREALKEQLQQVQKDEERQQRREQESRQKELKPGRAHENELDRQIEDINHEVETAKQELQNLGAEIREAMSADNPDEGKVDALQEKRGEIERKIERLLLRAEALEGQRGQDRKKDIENWLKIITGGKLSGMAEAIRENIENLNYGVQLINQAAGRLMNAYPEIVALMRDIVNRADAVGAAVPALPEIPLSLDSEAFLDLGGNLKIFHGEISSAMSRAASFRRYMAK